MWNMVIKVRRWPWLPKIHSSYLLLPFMPSKTLYKTTAILFSHNRTLGVQKRQWVDVSAQYLDFQVGELEWLGVTWPGRRSNWGGESAADDSPQAAPGLGWPEGLAPLGQLTYVLSAGRGCHRMAVSGEWVLQTQRERELTEASTELGSGLCLLFAAFCWLQAVFIRHCRSERRRKLNSASWERGSVARSHCRRACGMGNVVTIFGDI